MSHSLQTKQRRLRALGVSTGALLTALAGLSIACGPNDGLPPVGGGGWINPPVGCEAVDDALACNGAIADIPVGCDGYVMAGDEDQLFVQYALVGAPEGYTLCLDGTFMLTEQLDLDSNDDLTIKGVNGAVLDFSMQDTGANGIKVSDVNNFTIEDIEIHDTRGDGIRVEQSQFVIFRNVKTIWNTELTDDNGAYGIYPVQCEDVLIEGCTARGASDSGIYVGQSRNVIVRDNEAFENVAGIEIENTVGAEVYNNIARDNTGGILVFDLPGLTMQGGQVLVRDNVIMNNNEGNFAPAGSVVSRVPAGTGVMILSMDEVEVRDNMISGNDTTGLLIVSYEIVEQLNSAPTQDMTFEPDPETIFVHDNMFSSNGETPDVVAAQILSGAEPPLESIVWDGLTPEGVDDTTLCLQNNGDATYRNFNLVRDSNLDFEDAEFDLAIHDCEHAEIPAVTLPPAMMMMGSVDG